ncbi:hypothetical protein A6A04_11515 [Paramagnetospirillum marisnigri]|uniref:Glycosyltransferase RgtA/B/C/D-like domain-containing protein n=1 Tax=Paramagnetospirillum marisnigri TaxID=1285242 RepID=A0A178MX05_9PROT|nr:hypothetical protein [Paramagnetospirillum marisnigri]OAN55276.1 hypothetical protein A6A04_11515 [Paramagnetospirillum marisnigri]
MPDLIAFFLPSASQLLALAGVLVVACGFSVIGAALGGRDRLPEADLLVGWSVVALVFVVFGGWLGFALTPLAVLSALLAFGAGVVLWRRGEPMLDRDSLKVMAWMAPLLLATASMAPSQWDEFTQWLPNSRYLVLFDHFPGAAHPPSDSVFPAYPPGITVVYLLVSRLGGGFFDTIAPWFNLLLLAATARLAVRLFRGDDQPTGWTVCAWGVLAVTSLGTTFVPKLVLSGYADTATAVAVAFSAVLGLRLRQGRAPVIQFGFVFALLPMTKQGNFALMGLLLVALGLDALLRREPLMHLGRRLALGLLPMALAVLAWRLHVTAGVGELSVRPPATWEWHLLPAMLTSMKDVALSKGGYFGFGLVLVVLAVAGRGRSRLVTLFALCFLGYNLFLLFVYLAILAGYESANAASFWRYNTHLGLFQMLVLALVAGEALRRLGLWGRPDLRRAALALGGLAAVAVPFAALKWIRFDRNPAKLDAYRVIREMTPLVPFGAPMLTVDARGTGFYGNFASYHMGYGRRMVANVTTFNVDGLGQGLAAYRPAYLWVRTLNPAVVAVLGLPLDERASHLLAAEGTGWRVVKSWPYPPGLDPAAEKE